MTMFDLERHRSNLSYAAKHFDATHFVYLESEEIIETHLDFFLSQRGHGFATALFHGPLMSEYSKCGIVNLTRSCANANFLARIVDHARLQLPYTSIVGDAVFGDKAFSAGIQEERFDLIISNLSLDTVVELPKVLTRIWQSLKVEGVFVGVILGGHTLKELRHSLQRCDEEFFGKIYPRIMPHIDIKSIAMLMQGAGFRDVVSDSNSVTGLYDSVCQLMKDVKALGKGNCLNDYDAPYFSRGYVNFAETIHPRIGNDVAATFDFVSFSGVKKS